MSKPVTREGLLASLKAFRPEALDVPELGETVFLRPLSLAGMSKLGSAKDEKDGSKVAVAVIIECVCDESGARLFTEADRESILQMPSGAATRIVEAVTSGALGKSVKEATGN